MSKSSIEEQVEDIAKKQLSEIKYYTKTEVINSEIEKALKIAPSKSGGSGKNFPDIKLFIETKDLRYIPVMIEVKGKKGDFIKLNSSGEIDNKTKDGSPHFNNINKYAVNGAIHYANAIIEHTESYKEVIAIGINGYYQSDKIKLELGVYYVSAENYFIPKKIDDYDDLTFLLPNNIDELIDKITNLNLTSEEIEKSPKKLKMILKLN